MQRLRYIGRGCRLRSRNVYDCHVEASDGVIVVTPYGRRTSKPLITMLLTVDEFVGQWHMVDTTDRYFGRDRGKYVN